ncbi:unnamed protein product [Lepidochelys olivacea]
MRVIQTTPPCYPVLKWKPQERMPEIPTGYSPKFPLCPSKKDGTFRCRTFPRKEAVQIFRYPRQSCAEKRNSIALRISRFQKLSLFQFRIKCINKIKVLCKKKLRKKFCKKIMSI